MTTLDKRSRTLLEESSLTIIRDCSNVFEKKFVLRPTLLGEDYMEEIWSKEDNG